MKDQLTLIVVLVLGTSSSEAFEITQFEFGDWPNTISMAFERADDENTKEETVEEPGGYKAFVQITAEGGPASINFGVNGGDVTADLQYSFFEEDGAFNASAAFLSPGWSAEPTFAYDPQTFAGSLSWTLSYQQVPDVGSTGLMAGLGLLGLVALRKFGAPVLA